VHNAQPRCNATHSTYPSLGTITHENLIVVLNTTYSEFRLSLTMGPGLHSDKGTAYFPAMTSSLSVNDVVQLVNDNYKEYELQHKEINFKRVNMLFLRKSLRKLDGKEGSKFLKTMKESAHIADLCEEYANMDIRSTAFKKCETAIHRLLLNMQTVSNMDYIRTSSPDISSSLTPVWKFRPEEEYIIRHTLIYLTLFWISCDQMLVNNEYRDELVAVAKEVTDEISNSNDIYALEPTMVYKLGIVKDSTN